MAGLIPQQFIDELLERSDIVDIVGNRLQLKKTGRNYSALCPFHQEKTPSFSVNQEKQFYYCFGCGAGGNSLQFIMDYDRIDFPQAIEHLAQQQGLQVPHEKNESTQVKQLKNDNLKLYSLMEEISQFYQRQLANSPAQTYLLKRQLKQDSIARFELGYAPNAYSTLLQHFGRNEDLLKTGMLIRRETQQPHDLFRNRLIFPIRDRRGRIVAFGGRALDESKPKYINSPETPLFHKSKELYGLYQTRQTRGEPEYLIVCEGYMDVIALHQHGIHNAVATLGTATNEEHLKILFRYSPNLIFSFDGDSAGQRAAQRALHILLPQLQDGRQIKFLFLPNGEDPDSIVNKQGKSGFAYYIRNAKHLSDFFFDMLIPNQSAQDDLGIKARLSKLALPLIEKIPGRAYRQLLLQELQKRTGLQQDTLIDLLEEQAIRQQHASHSPSSPQTSSTPKERPPLRQPQKTLRLTPAKRALSLMLNHPELAIALNTAQLPQISEDQTLLYEVITHIQLNACHSNHRLLGHWLNHPKQALLLRLLADGATLGLNQQAAQVELSDCIIHLCKKESTLVDAALIQTMAAQRSAAFAQLDPELQLQIKKIQHIYKTPRD